MQVGKRGVDLIKGFEELKLRAYRCPAGKWTIGYGHTGSDVHEGQEITESRADELLFDDLGVAQRAVLRYCTEPLTQNQFDALVSFVFNVGESNFRLSTLLRYLNEGDMPQAAGQFRRWIFARDKVLPGLVRRREAERQLFLAPD